MRALQAKPSETREAVERFLRETALSLDEISARTGIARSTISTWNARCGWPRPRRRWHDLTARWPEPRRAALARLLSQARNEPEDVAEAAGLGRAAGARLRSIYGVAHPEPPVEPDVADAAAEPGPLDAGAAADPPILRAHLRAHIARQIAAFDAALRGEGAAALDSARVLRDLGGLKRLLDEIAPGNERERGEGGDGGTGPDLPALRTAIARRYAGFVRGGTAA